MAEPLQRGTFTAAALTIALCIPCQASQGLCTRHKRDVLPQLAINVGWLKLMGDPKVEQTTRQAPKTPPHSALFEQSKLRHAKARETARSKRRGYYGLARAIAATP